MEKKDMIWTATVAFNKGMDYETLMYSDYMNGNKEHIDEVWEYVTEIKEDGTTAFYENYSEYKLY